MLHCLICTERCWLHKAAPPFVGADNAGPAETPTWAEWAYLRSILAIWVMSSSLSDVRLMSDVGWWSLSLTLPIIGGWLMDLEAILRSVQLLFRLPLPSFTTLVLFWQHPPLVLASKETSKLSHTSSSLCTSSSFKSKHRHNKWYLQKTSHNLRSKTTSFRGITPKLTQVI